MIKPRLQLAVELSGDLAAGVLLYRAAYWQERARIERGGRLWAARRSTALMAECGLSEKQYRRGMRLLRKLRLLDTRQGVFGNRTILHFSLSGETQLALGMTPPGPTQDSPKGTDQDDPEGPAQVRPRGRTPYKEEGKYGEENTGMKGELTLASGQEIGQGIPRKVQEGQNVMPFPKKGHLAKDVIKPTVHEKKHGPDRAARLEHIWKTELSSVYADDGCVVPWTMKQKGMARHLIKACTKPDASEVLRYAIRNWSAVCSYAQHEHALKKAPGKPDLPFLLVNVQSAINCMMDDLKPGPLPVAAQSSVINHLPTSTPADPEHKPATLEEAKAILGDLW